MSTKLEKSLGLFFGCKIDSKMREGLAQAKPGDRHYFEDENSQFLRVLQLGEEKWIGKVVAGGTQLGEIADLERNILSILKRIAPAVRVASNAMKIFAVVADDLKVEAPETDSPVTDIEDAGPYIDY